MKILSTTVTALAALGMVAGLGLSASACEWHKTHETAAATPAPVEETAAIPATTVDPVRLADLDRTAILPRTPEEDGPGTEAE